MKTTRMRAAIGIAGTLASCLSATARVETPAYRNLTLPLEQRVGDLLNRMTLEEKIAQLLSRWPVKDVVSQETGLDASKLKSWIGDGVGTIGPIRWETAKEVTLKNDIQKYLIANTRLGIPAIFHDEGCHGVLAPGATSFPVPIGIACSWDPAMIEKTFGVVAAEMRARGSQFALTPVVDICREPRWGRTDETLGEDPYLNGTLGTAIVFGLQGHDYPSINGQHVAATLKHLTGHGQPEGGVNRAPGNVTLHQLFEAHLVPFRMAIATAHPAAVMPSYNEVDGTPSHANTWLLQDVLRKQFGFTGIIASDYDGITDISGFHHVATNDADATLQAFNAGVDMDLPNGLCYGKCLAALVREGKIPIESINASVSRVLSLKFHLGLFEQPFRNPQQAIGITKLESSKALALEAARKSIVLLKNKNDILPLAKSRYHRIAVVGPNAAETHLGSYPGTPWYKVSLLEGIKEKLAGSAEVLYAEGCEITKNNPDTCLDSWEKPDQEFPTPGEDATSIKQAAEVVKGCDLIILAVGENERLTHEAWAPNHIGDRPSLGLFGRQQDLADAMLALGKPVIVYLMNSRPLAIPSLVNKADAVLEGWYMGQETGHAAAEILFGDVNPSGKLTITIPRSAEQLPLYYNHKPSALRYAYVGADNSPLFPFGFGLSYTTYSYSEPKLAAHSIHKDGKTEVLVNVTNTGKVKGDEIVQFYLHEKVSSVARPVKELRGFQRISLEPGQSREVVFPITPDDLAFHNVHMERVVEPGDFEVMVGPSSAEVKTATLRVTE